MSGPIVGIIMGSESDFETLRHAAELLTSFAVQHEVAVVSAHRTPERMFEYAGGAEARGLRVIIAGAGGAAHLPGMVAALTPLPVLGVPVESKALNGLDSLLSIVQMPAGVPVATFAIGAAGAKNAALFAVRMLALSDAALGERLAAFRKSEADKAIASSDKLGEMKRVGILGGGQLGLLLAEAVRNLGGRPRFYDPEPEAPAARHFADTVTAAWTDEAALARFTAGCDVLTYEFENIVTSGLRALPSLPPIRPSLEALETAQHRLREKQFLERAGLPHVEFRAARTVEELRAAARELGYPVIVKTAGGGYDGKGQRFVHDENELAAVGETEIGWVIEEPIALEREVSCIVARAPGGEEQVFPLLENLHREHILDRTLVPARVSPALAAEARELALEAARALDVRGLLTVEFFVGRSARRPGRALFVNELAPRPHNSGHVTLAACTLSQFNALARILLDVPVGEPRLAGPGAYCMGNLLGDVWLAQGRDELDLSAWARHPAVLDVTLYGKRGARERRKMGHFIAHAASGEQALDEAQRFRASLAQK